MKQQIWNQLSKILSPYYFAQIKRVYLHIRHGKIPQGLNFKNPRTFNEKINYLKLYRTQNKGSILADKIDVKEYIKEKIGNEYLIPTIAIYNTVDEIEWDNLPNSFVIKASHSSGMNFICPDKSEVEKTKILQEMSQWLKGNYADEGGEWQYNLTPRLICEEYLENTAEDPLLDYKFFCFNGKAKFIQIDTDRYSEHSRNIYNIKWELQPFTILYKNSTYAIAPPENLEKMTKIAERLSENYTFFRVDLYNYKGHIYFGEMTFHPGGGCEIIEPYEYDKILGDFLKI